MTQKILPSIEYCQSITDRRTVDELKSISHVKRFLEALTGDQKFREQIRAHPANFGELAQRMGIDLDFRKFSDKFVVHQSPNDGMSEDQDFPLALLWKNWISDWLTFVRLIRDDGYSSVVDRRFNAWRKRQVERVNLEFGKIRGDAVSHPIFSFELSKGCSVGCWFCALGAETFKGFFQRTPKNVVLWRDILGIAVDLFGPAAQTSACYWATEPFDNPNYLDFIEDYRQIVGLIPQTTSAAPMRDLVWTRRLMGMHDTFPSVPSRFSVVNSRILRDLHATFSPMKLLNYELIMQLKGSSYGKTRAGKTLNAVSPVKRRQRGSQICEEAGSIACVSGYIVNMVDRQIQLVSPTIAKERWPLGYRLHASGTFTGPKEFGDFIESSISGSMSPGLPSDQPVSYRASVAHESRTDGFALSTDYAVNTFTGTDHLRQLGEMIAQGAFLPNQIVASLVDDGADMFEVRGTLQDLFEKGFLEDLP